MPPENNQQPTSNTNSQQENSSPLKRIRTFQGDVAEALGKQKESIVSIQRAAAKKREVAPPPPKPKAPRKPWKIDRTAAMVMGTILLVIFGGAGGWYAYQEYLNQTTAPSSPTPTGRFFAVDETERTNITASSSRSDILTQTNNLLVPLNTSLGETKHLSIDISTERLLSILGTRAPGALLRSFDESFMLGSFGKSSGDTSIFLIIKLDSFQNAFAGMLDWEENIFEDIGILFGKRDATSTTTPEFIDITDRNKDIRSLLVGGTETLMMYSFFDNNMLIITDHIETMRVIVDRLNREKLSR